MAFATIRPSPHKPALEVATARTVECRRGAGLTLTMNGLEYDVPPDTELVAVHDLITHDIVAIFGPTSDRTSRRDVAAFLAADMLTTQAEQLLDYIVRHRILDLDPAGGLYLLVQRLRDTLNRTEVGQANIVTAS